MTLDITAPRRRFEGPLELVGRYRIVRHIGRGGMADVYHAVEDAPPGREVALKVMLPGPEGEAEAISMLLDEARIVGAIDHPNVVRLLDAGRAGDDYYLALELVDGQDLRQLIARTPGGLPLAAALDLTDQVAAALEAVHGAVDERGQPREIVHRDVSAGNVLVDAHGRARLGDFGIARARERMTRTRVGVVKGKTRYLAPELLDGRVADHRCDLFYLGVLCFELIFGEAGRAAVRPTIYGPMFAWPDRLPRPLPPAVVRMLRRLTAPDPAHRHQTATELRAELRDLARSGDEAEGITSPFARRPSRRPWLAPLAVAFPLAAAALIAIGVGVAGEPVPAAEVVAPPPRAPSPPVVTQPTRASRGERTKPKRGPGRNARRDAKPR